LWYEASETLLPAGTLMEGTTSTRHVSTMEDPIIKKDASKSSEEDLPVPRSSNQGAEPPSGKEVSVNALLADAPVLQKSLAAAEDVILTDELLKCNEELLPFDFGPYGGADLLLSKFSWTSLGMSALLKSLAVLITPEERAIMKRRRSLEETIMETDVGGPPPVSSSTKNRKSNSTTNTVDESRNHRPTKPSDKKEKAVKKSPPHRKNNKDGRKYPPPASKKMSLQQQQQQHRDPYPPTTGATNPEKMLVPSAKPPNRRPTTPAVVPPPPAVALKPIRRLAKVRPYANQAIPVSMEDIYNAIPKEASAVFHVLDRRINLDAFGAPSTKTTTDDWNVSVPVYSLLRAWVQDDPCRQVPHTHQVVLTPATTTMATRKLAEKTPNKGGVSSPASAMLREPTSIAKQQGKKKKHTSTSSDVIGYMTRAKHMGLSVVPLDDLRKEMMEGTQKKNKKRRLISNRDVAQIMKRLQEWDKA
jgi:hypothetical protein